MTAGIVGTLGEGRMNGRTRCRRGFELSVMLCLAAASVGCVGYPVPLSAQAGSTISIPIAAGSGGAAMDPTIGYGGLSYTDHQRGEMVYQLGGPGGFELRTRFSVAATPHASSIVAGSGAIFSNPPAIISIVDIPANAPEGTHSLHVIRRMPDGTEFPGPTYSPEIKVLPNSVELTDGSETIVGAFTPSAIANCTWQCGFAHRTGDVVPRPRLRLNLLGDGVAALGAFEVDVSYDASIIDVVDAFEETNSLLKAANDTAVVWLEDDGAGLARVFGLAHPDFSGQPALVWTIEVVFTLDDGNAQTLDLVADPGAVQLSILAYDTNGNVIPGATVSIAGIR